MDQPDVMVYLMTGFLDSGKTQFLKFTLEQDYFQIPGTTLLILCEEGEEEYGAAGLKKFNIVVERVESQEELTEEEIVEQIMRAYQNMQNAPSTNQYTFYHNWLFDPESFLTDRKEDVVVTLDGNLGDAQGNDFLRAVSEGIGKSVHSFLWS